MLDRSLAEIWATKGMSHVNLKATPTFMRALRVQTSGLSTYQRGP